MTSLFYRPEKVQNLPALRVQVRRGHAGNFFLESQHEVQAVVLYKNEKNDSCSVVFGDGDLLIFPRSAIKLMQALLLVESGAIEKFNLDKSHVALACASHHGSPAHIHLLEAWLKKIGLPESALVCGAHPPYDVESANELIRKNLQPSRLHNNCSGKHLGLLSALLASADQNAQPNLHYQKWDHPLQKSLRQLLCDAGGTAEGIQNWGVDGCGIPSYQMPIWALANVMARFLDPDFHPLALDLIQNSLAQHPMLLGGQKSLCSQVVDATAGEVILKTGAEGVYAGFSKRRPMAFALKAVDGATRAAEIASLRMVQKFAGLRPEEERKLQSRLHPELRNWANEPAADIHMKEIVL